MKIRITKDGLFGNDGPIPVGTEISVKEEPKAWGDRYEIVAEAKGKTAVTNPAKNPIKSKG